MSYHKFLSEDGKDEYGSFEVFYMNERALRVYEWGSDYTPGWYWWACFPGCLPDGDAQGPYATEDEAIEAARNE